jgi:NAD+ kinase
VATVGFVIHRERETAVRLAADAAAWLRADGHQVRLSTADAAAAALDDHGVPEHDFAEGLDVVVSLGGDGTMLRTVDLVAAAGVPVLGVNVGQLGYLTDADPPDLRSSLSVVLEGRHVIEERMLLAVTVERRGQDPAAHLALNEAVLEKTPMGHTVRLAVSVDGDFFTTYAADGLIVATPTGSTAYAFSARGPIVAPTHRALLLTPVSPHMLFDRTLVLDPDASVRLEVDGQRTATVSVDGRNLGELEEGDAVVCTASATSARLVTSGERDFLSILKAKFGLNDR